jgi:hypothetical protein
MSLSRSNSRIPVALVTLTSVMKSPMTSIPANSRPRSHSRFAASFRQLFGELPSETLRTNKRRRMRAGL